MNEFKVRGFAYVCIPGIGLKLTKVTAKSTCISDEKESFIKADGRYYTKDGKFDDDHKLPSLFPATPAIRAALVTLYGEENVPPLPLSRHEIIVELLKRQKFVVCKVCSFSYEEAIEGGDYTVITDVAERDKHCYEDYDRRWRYAIAVDMNGDEITELPEADDAN